MTAGSGSGIARAVGASTVPTAVRAGNPAVIVTLAAELDCRAVSLIAPSS
ncbi:MAG TPA: hypothetical protein VFP72_11565 [Kineosporiaceae bacterium]|nr:hypothetical protein [Kineosporiaceae bacterium]